MFRATRRFLSSSKCAQICMLLIALTLLLTAFPPAVWFSFGLRGREMKLRNSPEPLTLGDWKDLRHGIALEQLIKYIRLPLSNWKDFDPSRILGFVPQSTDCEHEFPKRMGERGPWNCGHRQIPSECVVLRLGGEEDYSWEEAIHKHSDGNCRAFVVDCMKTHEPPSMVTFYPWCLGIEREHRNGHIYKPWNSILQELETTYVDTLYLDLDGKEWIDFPLILEQPQPSLPRQIILKLHLDDESVPEETVPELRYKNYNSNFFIPVMRLFKKAYDRGYGVVSVERESETVAQFLLLRTNIKQYDS